MEEPGIPLIHLDDELGDLSGQAWGLGDCSMSPVGVSTAGAAAGGEEARGGGSGVRRGKWTQPECDYAAVIIEYFTDGRLPGLYGGESLRATLSELSAHLARTLEASHGAEVSELHAALEQLSSSLQPREGMPKKLF